MTTFYNPGTDVSGNGNNWTPVNINWTATGTTYDMMTDVPTLTSATASNFCTWNPLDTNTSPTITGANLNTANSSESWASTRGTIAISSGKWYFETTIGGSGTQIGVYNANTALVGDLYSGLSIFYACNNGYIYVNSVGTDTGVTGSANDVIGVALDLDLGTVKFYKNNTQLGSTVTGVSGTFTPAISHQSQSAVSSTNFGQRPFAYTPPTGFVALNTFNLPTPTIGATASTQASDYFNAVTYTGTGATQTITGVGFQPDFTWFKCRSNADNHVVYDAVRGGVRQLYPNLTDAEYNVADGFSAFASDGFTLNNTGAGGNVNINTRTYVAWNWKANGAGVTNTAGSITSTVSANTSSGFSVVTYTGTGSNATVGHGLGVAPQFVIVKARSAAIVWIVGATSIGWGNYLYLNATDAVAAGSNVWNSTAPTSSVFSIGTGIGGNQSGTTYVAYCFSEIAGYSKFGSYTGNGSTDGTFVYTGFRPKFILYKNASYAGTGWAMLDSSRNTYNVLNARLFSDSSSAEDTSVSPMDFTSNGFKVRSTNDGVNRSGDNIIYMAFAEFPTKFSLAR